MPKHRRIKTHLQVMQAIKDPPGRHGDMRVPGLYLIVGRNNKTGGRNARWVYRFTKPSTGKVTELGLGPFDVLSLEQARDIASAHRKALKREGKDPVEAKREVKAQRVRAQLTTFGALVADYIAEKATGWSASTVVHVRLLLQRHAQALADKPITSVSSDDVVDALKHLRHQSPVQERRALAAVSRVFEYAQGRDLCDRNPALWRGRMQTRYPRRNGHKHYTAMPYDQVPEFVRKLRAAQAQNTALSPPAIEFLLLTACRVSEVTNMRWDEIDGELRLWTIPGERTKTGKEHRVPLSDRALQLLIRSANSEESRSDESRGGWVWPGRKESAPINTRSLYTFLTVIMGLKVTLHGFRSTFRDWAGDTTHFARDHVEECLAHSIGNAVERAYRRSDALEKRREIMQAWANYCS